MPRVDFNERLLELKLVYSGPPRSGKTTNLRALHARVADAHRGRLMTLDTQDDRTVFFDLLPVTFRAGALAVRVKLYTVPGQPVHEWTRRLVLQHADGVVFVADSAAGQRTANREAWDGLTRHLAALRLSAAPVVVQYNKRDALDRVPMESADRFGTDAALFEAQAVTGLGVVETFLAALERTWDAVAPDLRLDERLGVSREAFVDALRAQVVGAPVVLPSSR